MRKQQDRIRLAFKYTAFLVVAPIYAWVSVRLSSIASTPPTRLITLKSPANLYDLKDPIRKWGCRLKQTPFVFVHIGKAGGGNIRRRIAVSAVDFEREAEDWFKPHMDNSYYPIQDDEGKLVAKASFCNSGHFNYRPRAENAFEGVMPCSASTPLGIAIACAGAPHEGQEDHCGGDPSNPDSAHVVYVGHNNIGSELHWLPVPILKAWWETYWTKHSHWNNSQTEDEISKAWLALDGKKNWCGEYSRPLYYMKDKRRIKSYFRCGKTRQDKIDQTVNLALTSRNIPLRTSLERGRAYAALYASLPVIRVTMVRKPFTWLISKFLWHELEKTDMACDNIEDATFGSSSGQDPNGKDALVLGSSRGRGWARRFALTYIYNLCGTDCASRQLKGEADLEEIVVQAEYNLRHSFAVVGILEEGDDEFFNMIHARVAYMDLTTNKDKVADDGKHGTSRHGEAKRCKERFSDVDFQAKLGAASPEIAALEKLYNVALEVNQFQKQELEKCEDSFMALSGLGKNLNKVRPAERIDSSMSRKSKKKI